MEREFGRGWVGEWELGGEWEWEGEWWWCCCCCGWV